jgi:hypothetical protein
MATERVFDTSLELKLEQTYQDRSPFRQNGVNYRVQPFSMTFPPTTAQSPPLTLTSAKDAISTELSS